MATAKENNAERIKREKDGLEVIHDIRRYARTGFQSITPDDLDRFKWYGLYTQKPAEEGYFMLRIRIPNGVLSAEQLETIGWLSRVYAQNTGDITTRQDIQYHYVRIADVPHIFAELDKVGLTTLEACGDVVRQVVGSPLAGIDDDELIDAYPLVRKVSELFLTNRDFSNLPRKFKISISGFTEGDAQHQINDIGLVAALNAEGEAGFDLWVGGGLGSRPYMAKRLGVFVWYDEAVAVITRIIEIFRDHGYREDRRKARLKFLLADWGVEKFRAELETRLGRALEDLPEPSLAQPSTARLFGAGLQRRTGANGRRLYYLGTAVLRGRISGAQMTAVAGVARRYASGNVRLTNAQNLIIIDIPEENLAAARAELAALDLLSEEASAFRRGTVSCTGRQFCKLAVVETKERAAEIVHYLDEAIPDFREELRISVTGCVNSCAQYQIADIGLVGVKGQVNGEEVDFFQIHLGGHLGQAASFGRKLAKRVRVEEAKFYLERLVHAFRLRRHDDERFYEFIARHTTAELETLDEQLLSEPELEETLA